MRKQYLILPVTFALCIAPVMSIAQTQENALPQIPTNSSPPNPASPERNLPNIDAQNKKAYVNPLDVIKEKENQNNRSGRWEASSTGTEPKPDADKEENPASQKQAIIDQMSAQKKVQETLEKNAAEAEASANQGLSVKDAPTEQETEKSENTDTAETEDTQNQKETVANKNDRQAGGDSEKKETKSQRKEKAIQQINNARKSIIKPEAPKRTWNLN